MSYIPIKFQGKELSIHKSSVQPSINSKTVLVQDTWDYVEIWLKRENKKSKKEDALFHWEQAKIFFNSSKNLPATASPLTLYYCFLNATKTLLNIKGISYTDKHGVSGESHGHRNSLTHETVKYHQDGVLAGLSDYLEEKKTPGEFTLKDLLYNLPFIHRAYNLTLESQPELFIPVEKPLFVRKKNSKESWFCTEIADKKYANQRVLNKLPNRYEKEKGIKDKFIIRCKDRFNWDYRIPRGISNKREFIKYHKKIRRDMVYIYSSKKLWYLKRGGKIDGLVNRNPLTIIFAIMHKLSELSRYHPTILKKYLEGRYNWLLSEFINISSQQFIDEISSEITGQNFMKPGIRT